MPSLPNQLRTTLTLSPSDCIGTTPLLRLIHLANKFDGLDFQERHSFRESLMDGNWDFVKSGAFKQVFGLGKYCLKFCMSGSLKDEHTYADLRKFSSYLINRHKRKHFLPLIYKTKRALAGIQVCVDTSLDAKRAAHDHFDVNLWFFNHHNNVGYYNGRPVIFDWE